MPEESDRRVHIFVCTNERAEGSPLPCCAQRGGQKLLERFRTEAARRHFPAGLKVSGSTCLTTCQWGPTVAVYPEGIWYGNVQESDVADIVETHLAGSGTVARLRLPENVRVW